jgi:hypothetical protein
LVFLLFNIYTPKSMKRWNRKSVIAVMLLVEKIKIKNCQEHFKCNMSHQHLIHKLAVCFWRLLLLFWKSLKQQNSTNPWIGWAFFSLTWSNPEYGPTLQGWNVQGRKKAGI